MRDKNDLMQQILTKAQQIKEQNETMVDHLVLFLVPLASAIEILSEQMPEFRERYWQKCQDKLQLKVAQGNQAALMTLLSALEKFGKPN